MFVSPVCVIYPSTSNPGKEPVPLALIWPEAVIWPFDPLVNMSPFTLNFARRSGEVGCPDDIGNPTPTLNSSPFIIKDWSLLRPNVPPEPEVITKLGLNSELLVTPTLHWVPIPPWEKSIEDWYAWEEACNSNLASAFCFLILTVLADTSPIILALFAIIVPLELILPEAVILPSINPSPDLTPVVLKVSNVVESTNDAVSAVWACEDDNSNVISWDAETANEAVTANDEDATALVSNNTKDPVPSVIWPLLETCKTLW